MANYIHNRLTVVGLKENPEDFARELEMQMYGRVVPRESGNFFVEVVNGNFDYTTKWGPKVDALLELSKKRTDHIFLLNYGGFEVQRNGQVVISNGDVLESIYRSGYSGLFDEIDHPSVDLFRPYLRNWTLAERAGNRLQDAVGIVHELIRIMDDDRFTDSPCRLFSECRNRERTEKAREALATLADSIGRQVAQIDFTDVLLEEGSLQQGITRIAEENEHLMAELGINHLVPGENIAARFSILPFTAAVIKQPRRVVLPVLHYTNADPASGKYQTNADGSVPPIAWEIRYLCVRPADVKLITRLFDDNEMFSDIDLVMTDAGDRAAGDQFCCVSRRARWKPHPELIKAVEHKAIEQSRAFAARAADIPGVTTVDNFEAVEAAIFGNPFSGNSVDRLQEHDHGKSAV